MGVHKLTIDDWQEPDFELIAIHTSLENFRLAYFMNRQLQILLNKVTSQKKSISNPVIHQFNRFEYLDDKNDIHWHLLENKKISEIPEEMSTGLFSNNGFLSTTRYLVQEAKKADFICKIEGESFQINTNLICQKIKNIPMVNMVYSLDSKKIKNKNHLILS